MVLDLYADWCIACKVMERSIFPARPWPRRLHADRWRLDLTANTAQIALLPITGLLPPALFFDSRGQELQAYRLRGAPVGSPNRHLQAVLGAAPEESKQ